MSGAGEYRADRSEAITRVEDLPQAKLVQRSRNYSRRRCPELLPESHRQADVA